MNETLGRYHIMEKLVYILAGIGRGMEEAWTVPGWSRLLDGSQQALSLALRP
jgi:hypothetical protein